MALLLTNLYEGKKKTVNSVFYCFLNFIGGGDKNLEQSFLPRERLPPPLLWLRHWQFVQPSGLTVSVIFIVSFHWSAICEEGLAMEAFRMESLQISMIRLFLSTTDLAIR